MPLRFLKTLKLEDIEKRPLVVIVAILICTNLYFITRNDNREGDARKEVKEWQDRAWNLSIELLEKNRIIREKEEEVEELKSVVTDSVIREEVKSPLSNILK